MTTPSKLKQVRLEALDRRYAASPSTPSPSPNVRKTPSSTTPSSRTPSIRTPNYTSRIPARMSTDKDPIYEPLPDSYFTGEVAAKLKLVKTDGEDVMGGILKRLWSNSPKTLRDMENIMEKNNQVVLLDNPTTHQMYAEKARARAQQNAKHSRKFMSSKQRRKLGLGELEPKHLRYEIFKELHDMWKQYIGKLVSHCNDSMMQSRILTADLHGSYMQVVKAKNVSFVGIQGLMIKETENTFGIITTTNDFKVVPKQGSVFVIPVESVRVTLFGNNLSARSMLPEEDQPKKKKQKPMELF